MPAAKANPRIPRGLAAPLVCSLAAHVVVACPLLFLIPRTVRKPGPEAAALPVTILVEIQREPPASVEPKIGPPARTSAPPPRTIRPANRAAPTVAVLTANPGDTVASTEPASPGQPGSEDGTRTSDQSLAQSTKLFGSPVEKTEASASASGPGAGTLHPRAPGWSPGDGPWRLLREAVERHVDYPTVARRMNYKGKVVLTFTLRADGGVEDVGVRESSGHAVLDASAVQAVHRAVPLPHSNEVLTIVLPIDFALR